MIRASLILIPVVIAMTYIMVIGVTETGPGCPGMDPSYLGWCK